MGKIFTNKNEKCKAQLIIVYSKVAQWPHV